MKTEISFCPLCAGKLDGSDDEQFECEDCESKFFIQVVTAGDDEDEEEDEEEEEDDDERDEEDEEEEEEDEEDEY
jgi:hypothetical protein